MRTSAIRVVFAKNRTVGVRGIEAPVIFNGQFLAAVAEIEAEVGRRR